MTSIELFSKNIGTSVLVLKCFVLSYPSRLKRFAFHFKNISKNYSQDKNASVLIKNPFHYFTELSFYLMDLLGIPELYEIFSSFIKFKTRSLTEDEKRIALSIYGSSIDLSLVRVDEALLIGNKNLAAAYVGVNTINVYSELTIELLIHELIHVWQYQHFGSVYIPRALWAQRTIEAYDYGGEEKLAANIENGLLAFNYEQQGDVITDYYRIKHQIEPKWSKTNELALYEPYLKDLQQKKLA